MLHIKDLTETQSAFFDVLTVQYQLTATERKNVLSNIAALAVLPKRKSAEALKFDNSHELKLLKLDEAQQKMLSEINDQTFKDVAQKFFSDMDKKQRLSDALATKKLFSEHNIKDGDIFRLAERDDPYTDIWTVSAPLCAVVQKSGKKERCFFYGCHPNGEPVKNARNQYVNAWSIQTNVLKFYEPPTEPTEPTE